MVGMFLLLLISAQRYYIKKTAIYHNLSSLFRIAYAYQLEKCADTARSCD